MSVLSFFIHRVWDLLATGQSLADGSLVVGLARVDDRISPNFPRKRREPTARGLLVGVPLSLLLWLAIAHLAQNLL